MSQLKGKAVRDPGEWRQALERLPDPHVLQSWEWGGFKERYGWRATRWLWEEAGEPRAAALTLTRRPGPLPVQVMYVPKGPVLDYGDGVLLAAVLSELEGLARAERAVFVKIDPDVEEESPQGRDVTSLLLARGWRRSREQVQFRSTLLLDLTPEPEEILEQMKAKWRYNIRLAMRRGVMVREGGLADLPLLYQMYRETSLRNRFVIRPEAYYRDVWATFMQAGIARCLIAEVEGEPAAMLILYRFGRRAWYMYGASRSHRREWMPNHLLQWEAIRWAREQGCLIYDLWGAPEVLDESDPLWGVYRFKSGFGGRLVRYIGAYDYPTSPLFYWLYTVAVPRVLALMRRRYWSLEAGKGNGSESKQFLQEA